MNLAKKLSAFTLTILTIANLALSAYAEGSTSIIDNVQNFSHEVQVDSEIIVPVIEVVVPTTASIVLNPYKLPYGENNEKNDQIISTDINIINNSNVPVTVELSGSTQSTSTTGADNIAPRLIYSYNLGAGSTVEQSPSKYILLYLQDMDTNTKVAIAGDETNRFTFGDVDPNSTMNLRFTGAMSTKARWTGDESISISPVFKVNAITGVEN